MPNGVDVFGPTSRDDDVDLTLPVSRSDFADFLGRVIGGKDKLEYSFRGDIHISSEVLSGIEAALLERVESQNGGKLVSSRYDIRFANGRSYKTSSLDNLLALAPRGEAYTEFLSIELVFLIYYPSVATPAREKISLAFASEHAVPGRDTILSTRDRYERARCEIEYYNRVFAEDCLSTITSVVRAEAFISSTAQLLKREQTFLGSSLPTVTFCVTALAYCLGTYVLGDYLGWVPSEATRAGLSLEQKVDIILARFSPYLIGISTFVFVSIGLLASAIPAIMLSVFLPDVNVGRISFDLYEPDRKAMNKLAKRKSNRTVRAILGVLSSILLSLVAAFAYDKLMGRW